MGRLALAFTRFIDVVRGNLKHLLQLRHTLLESHFEASVD
jgi:hypothetical protein